MKFRFGKLLLDSQMVILDFTELTAPVRKNFDADEDWIFQIWFSIFYGTQIIKIDEADFSCEYPILGFARELNEIVYKLKNGSLLEYYQDPEGLNPNIRFAVTNKSINIRREHPLLGVSSANLALIDLDVHAVTYLSRVKAYCFTLMPELGNDLSVNRWLEDFSIPSRIEKYF